MDLVGESKEILEVKESIAMAAKSIAPTLIYGETGTGKELVAEEIYKQSNLKGNFVRVNCAAIQDSLLESELFGHVKGAFTGAYIQKIGKLRLAHDGLLFLDEITNMSPAIQAKILRAVEYQIFEPVGGVEQIEVNVRIITATNVNILDEIVNTNFRNDLYYRIGVIVIMIPPLRERIDDVPLLISHFVSKLNTLYNKDITSISPEAMSLLQAYHWPGNVRELKNVVERAVLCTTGSRITEKEVTLSPLLKNDQVITHNLSSKDIIKDTVHHLSHNGYKGRLVDAIDDFEETWMRQVLAEHNGVQKEAAKSLGISPRVLCYKMTKYGKKKEKET